MLKLVMTILKNEFLERNYNKLESIFTSDIIEFESRKICGKGSLDSNKTYLFDLVGRQKFIECNCYADAVERASKSLDRFYIISENEVYSPCESGYRKI